MGFQFPPDGPNTFSFMDQNFRAAETAAIRTAPNKRDTEEIARWVREAATRADLVLLRLHAHEQGAAAEDPAGCIPAFCHRTIDEGANMVVGPGSHLIRGMEICKGKSTFYSPGNFAGQNELVWKLPADAYERFRADPNAKPGDVYRTRTKHDTHSFPSYSKYWESLMPICRYEQGELAGTDVHSVTLTARRARISPWPATTGYR